VQINCQVSRLLPYFYVRLTPKIDRYSASKLTGILAHRALYLSHHVPLISASSWAYNDLPPPQTGSRLVQPFPHSSPVCRRHRRTDTFVRRVATGGFKGGPGGMPPRTWPPAIGRLAPVECTKTFSGQGLAPDPAGGAYSTTPPPIAGGKGAGCPSPRTPPSLPRLWPEIGGLAPPNMMGWIRLCV